MRVKSRERWKASLRESEGKLEGKIELLYSDFQLTIPEIAQRLELSEEYVKKIVDEIKSKGMS